MSTPRFPSVIRTFDLGGVEGVSNGELGYGLCAKISNFGLPIFIARMNGSGLGAPRVPRTWLFPPGLVTPQATFPVKPSPAWIPRNTAVHIFAYLRALQITNLPLTRLYWGRRKFG